MTKAPSRRGDALSQEKIVEAAIAILDKDGESALTFRTLAKHLATGSGAIYWHIADKTALLAAATDHIMARALTGAGATDPHATIRAMALKIFDTINAHPWLGAQLSGEPWQPAAMRIFERMGHQLHAPGVPEEAQFNAASALSNYILGLAGQYAAAARRLPRGTDRVAFLDNIAAQWMKLDPAAYPFMRRMAVQLPAHDDRVQFLAGIDLILIGIEAAKQT